MLLRYIVQNRQVRSAVLSLLVAAVSSAATFGKVVPIGGQASDIALDESRGALYIADYTTGRIDVMSLSNNTINRSITVPNYPGALALSPDKHYLVITHYVSQNGPPYPGFQPGKDAVTVIDLTNNQQRTFSLDSGPIGVAFGIKGGALIVTTKEFLLFDPASGAPTLIDTVANVAAQDLPAPLSTFPPEITAGSVTATGDGAHIFGVVGGVGNGGANFIEFSYNVYSQKVTAQQSRLSSPGMGPRVLAVNRNGSFFMDGWGLVGCGTGFLECTSNGPLLAQFPNSAGMLNLGSVAIRNSTNLIYAQFPQHAPVPVSGSQTSCMPNGTCLATAPQPGSVPPNLLVLDSDNLTVRDRIQLPENLAGRSVFNSDESVLYSVSDSGVMVLAMAQFDKAPRVVASVEDVVFRGNFCNSATMTQQIDVVDPSGNATPFQICVAGSATCLVQGVSITPSSGVTPAHVTISVDPATRVSTIGTTSLKFEIRSAGAVNMPPPPTRGQAETDYVTNTRTRFRVLINNHAPEDRGAFFNVPGEIVDLFADPARQRFYLLRQDKNLVQVYDSSSFNPITTLRTGTTPTAMAATFDNKFLLVANDNSQIVSRYDLESMQPVEPIYFPLGHYPRSIAVSANRILVASRVDATTDYTSAYSCGPPASSGSSTSSGSSAPAVSSAACGMIDFIDLYTSAASTPPSLGAWKNNLSASTTLTASQNGGTVMGAMPDGTVFLYDASADAFTVSRHDFSSLQGALAASSFGTYVVDHFMLNSSLVAMAPVANAADSSASFAFVDRDGLATAVSKSGSGYINRMQTATALGPLPTFMVEAPTLGGTDFPFRRTLAPLWDRSAIISLTTSGFTVLPWNYDAATVPPVLDRIVNSADFTKPIAAGGLVSIFGSQLSSMSLAAASAPLPTTLAESCLTVNGLVIPMIYVSPPQINAQLPFQMSGNADIVLKTPGGSSDALRTTVLPTAPAVFLSGTAGPVTGIPVILRSTNGELVTPSNPIHPSDHISIYLTGMGQTMPQVPSGAPAPSDPLSLVLVQPTVTLGGVNLPIEYAGLTPGSVGVYQINAAIPFKGLPEGFEIPLTITQGGMTNTTLVRVVN
jgi:uncharacterized protein (TIGR03437 family)